MIDKLPEIFTRVKDHVMSVIPGLTDDNFSSDQLNVPSTLPHVAIFYVDSAPERRLRDSSLKEKYTRMLIQVNVYSTKVYHKYREAHDILAAVDEAMYRMNFTRETYGQMNLDSSTNYRLIARYEAIADEYGFYRS